jgi:hypothetical protein
MDLDSVLKQMRTEYTPSEEDRQRVESALTATLLAGSMTGAAHMAVGTSTGIKGALTKGAFKLLPVWLKGAIGVSATIATLGSGIYGLSAYRAAQTDTHSPALSSATGVSPTRRDDAPTDKADQEVAPLEPATATPALTGANSQSVRPLVDIQRASIRPAAKAVHGRSITMSAPLTSLGELQMLSEASRALQEGRADDAHAVLREHERHYANTALAQERAGLTLLARCSKNDGMAKRDAAKFLETGSDSPLATRIKRECLQ